MNSPPLHTPTCSYMNTWKHCSQLKTQAAWYTAQDKTYNVNTRPIRTTCYTEQNTHASEEHTAWTHSKPHDQTTRQERMENEQILIPCANYRKQTNPDWPETKLDQCRDPNTTLGSEHHTRSRHTPHSEQYMTLTYTEQNYTQLNATLLFFAPINFDQGHFGVFNYHD